MTDLERRIEQLTLEKEELLARLQEAQETLDAIRSGEVDGLVVDGPEGQQIFVLQGVDYSYRMLIEEMHEGVISLAKDGTIMYANKFMAGMLGVPLKKIIGSLLDQYIHEHDVPAYEALLKRSETGCSFAGVRFKTGDGGFVPVYLSANRISNENMSIFCLVGTDFVMKVQHEKILVEERLSRSIIDQSTDVIIVCDARGKIIRVSRVVFDLVGRNCLNERFDDVFRIHIDKCKEKLSNNPPEFESFTIDHVIKGETFHFCEVSVEKAGNSSTPSLLSATPLLDGSEQVVGCIVNLTDISRRKQIEQQLRQIHKIEAISTLTGGIAHDYNNLLAIIMGNLSMAQEEIEPHSLMGGLLHEIEQASLKARDLTHQFLTLSQGGHPRKERGSIQSLLKEIPGQAQAHEGIEYAFSIQDDLRPVEYDSRQMHYAINNVFTNAVEAMPQGGTITIQAENKIIENQDKDSASPLKEGKYVKISIKDEGIGILEKHLNRIFDPYFSTKEKGVQKGMGLGLATAYAIVQKHGGHIMVNSTTGVGTTATIYLPANAAESKAPGAKRDDVEAQSTINKQQSTIQKILVMDDEEMLRTLTQMMLERLGYEVETVKDGVEAIETYKKQMDSGEPFDGVILDLTIKGGMGGAQAIKELIKIDPGVKAIVCSGYSNDPVLANYEEHGFRGAMAKPYQKADLESVLKKVLG